MAYRQRRKPDPLSVAPSAPEETAAPNPSPSSWTGTIAMINEPTDLAAAMDHIADLESQCRALRQRATSLELQQEASQRRMAAMELAIRRLPAAGNESAAKHATATTSRSTGEKKPGELGETPSIELPPWMMPSQDDLSGEAPKWTLLKDEFLTELDSRVDRFLSTLPEALAMMGIPSHAVQLRQWQRSEVRTIRRITRAITRRIICTDAALRRTESQMRDLAVLIIKSLDVPHPSEDIGDRAAWAQLLAEGGQTLFAVTGMLVARFQDADWLAKGGR
jgi:hypothetical protein